MTDKEVFQKLNEDVYRILLGHVEIDMAKLEQMKAFDDTMSFEVTKIEKYEDVISVIVNMAAVFLVMHPERFPDFIGSVAHRCNMMSKDAEKAFTEFKEARRH